MTFSCQSASHSSSVTSSKRACRAKPTLLTRTSRPPSSPTACFTSAAGVAGSERSATTCSASPIPGSALRPHVTTRAPSSASRRATSRPMPPVEPVTTHALPASPRSMARATVTAAVTTILLARHGETDWNREDRFQGHADPPLNELGRQQARELAESLADSGVAAVYASPLARASETAKIVAEVLGLPVETRTALREVDVGSWQGLTRDQVETRYPDDFRRWLHAGEGWSDGESYDELGRRGVADLLVLAAKHPGERILVVTHGGPV